VPEPQSGIGFPGGNRSAWRSAVFCSGAGGRSHAAGRHASVANGGPERRTSPGPGYGKLEMGAVEAWVAAGRKDSMASAKEILAQEVERLSDEDAARVLELLRSTKAVGAKARQELTREELIRRATGRPGIRPPDPKAPPFRKVRPIECPGIPASELLIRDRR